MFELGEIVGRVVLRDQFTGPLKALASGIEKTSDQLKLFGVGALATGFIMLGVTATITKSFKSITTSARDFETAFADVVKTVDSLDVDPFGRLNAPARLLRDEIRAMAREIPIVHADLAKIAAIGGRFGIATNEISKFTRSIAYLSVAIDGMSPEHAAAELAQFGVIMGTTNDELDRLASTFVHLGNKGSSLEYTIIEIARRFASVGKVVRMSATQVFGLSAAVANLGHRAQLGGTALIRTFDEIDRAVGLGGEQLLMFSKISGMTADELKEQWSVDAYGVFRRLLQGIRDFQTGGGNISVLMTEMFGKGANQSIVIKGLVQSLKELDEQMTYAQEGFITGSKHIEEARKKFLTYDNQVVLLTNKFEDMKIVLGGPLLEVLRGFITALDPVMAKTAELVDSFAALPLSTQRNVYAIATLVAAMGPLLIIMGTLITVSTFVYQSFNTLWRAFMGARGLILVMSLDMAKLVTIMRIKRLVTIGEIIILTRLQAALLLYGQAYTAISTAISGFMARLAIMMSLQRASTVATIANATAQTVASRGYALLNVQLLLTQVRLGALLLVQRVAIGATMALASVQAVLSNSLISVNLQILLTQARVAALALAQRALIGTTLLLTPLWTAWSTSLIGLNIRIAATQAAIVALSAGQKVLMGVTLAWNGIVAAITGSLGLLNVQIALTSIRLYLLQAAQKAVALGLAAWTLATNGQIATLALLYLGIAKAYGTIGLLTVAQYASAVAARVNSIAIALTAGALHLMGLRTLAATVGMMGFGAALRSLTFLIPSVNNALGILAVTLAGIKWAAVAALVWALVTAVKELPQAFRNAAKAFEEGGLWGFLTQTEPDNFVRRGLDRMLGTNLAGAASETAMSFDEAAEAAQRLRQQVSGELLQNDVQTLATIFGELQEKGALTEEVVRRIGQQAMMLKQQGAALTPELERMLAIFMDMEGIAPFEGALGGTGKLKKQVDEVLEAQKAAREAAASAAHSAMLDVTGGGVIADAIRKIEAFRQAQAAGITMLREALVDVRNTAHEAIGARARFGLEVTPYFTAARDELRGMTQELTDLTGVGIETGLEFWKKQGEAIEEAAKTSQENLRKVLDSVESGAWENQIKQVEGTAKALLEVGKAHMEAMRAFRDKRPLGVSVELWEMASRTVEEGYLLDMEEVLVKTEAYRTLLLAIAPLVPAAFSMLPQTFSEVDSTLVETERHFFNFGKAVTNMSTAFQKLSQISRDGLSGMMQSVGDLIGLMAVGVEIGEQLQAVLTKKTGRKDEYGDPVLGPDGKPERAFSSDLLAGREGAAAAASAYMDLAIAAIQAYSAMQAATDVAGRGNRVLRGMMTGHSIGNSLFPIIGGWFGAIVGAIWGWARKPVWEQIGKRIGNRLGVSISEELARAIQEDTKNLFGGDMKAAEVFNLSEIISEAGGVTKSNWKTFLAEMRDAFVMVETGMFSLAQLTEVLDDNFSSFLENGFDGLGFMKDELREIIRLAREFGVHIDAISKWQGEQAGAVSDAFNIVGNMSKLFADARKVGEAIADARAELEQLNAVAATERGAEWQSDMLKATTALNDALAKQAGLAETSERALADMGTLAVGAVFALVATGTSLTAAIEKNGAGIDALIQAYKDLGVEATDPLFRLISIQRELQNVIPNTVKGVDALGEQIVGMFNLNILTGETLEAAMRTGYDAYVAIQGEVANLGGTTRDALIPMQGYLQRVEKAARDLGITLDENTLMMIEQSKELGIWQALGPSATEVFQSSVEALTEVIDRLIDALLGIPSELPNPFKNWKMPQIPGELVVPDPPDGPPPPYSSGTKATHGKWFPDFGRESIVAVHNQEAIVPKSRAGEFVADYLSSGRQPSAAPMAAGAQASANRQPIYLMLRDHRILAEVVFEEEPFVKQAAGIWR